MVEVSKVAENIYMIDDQLYSIPKYGSVYLINEDKKVLIDSGPTTSANSVLNGIKAVGVRPEDIDYIIATHIHLDHSGGAGVLLQDMPQAQVVVHYKGAKHLVDPANLISSMTADQGEEVMIRYGEVVPIESGRVQAIYDGDTIKLSDRQVLKFIDAPGHASHELCIHESRNNGIFAGDAAGVFIPEGEILLPSPNRDPELCVNTLRRLMELNATTVYFSHFGTSNKVQQILQSAIDKLQAWNEIVDKTIKDNMFESASERMVAQICAELEPVRKMKPLYTHLINHFVPESASFHIKYYQRKALKNSESNQ